MLAQLSSACTDNVSFVSLTYKVVTGELANEIVGPWDKDPVLFVITFTRDTPECRTLAVDIEEAAKATESNPSIRFVTVSQTKPYSIFCPTIPHCVLTYELCFGVLPVAYL